jgi:hypothetical protein
MASFPAAVKTFATRSPGQTIGSAHMNDVQDEINAIEDGYLNGTARLNAGNSTLANLSVTGGTTLAATLSVGGASTFVGNVTMNGSLTVTGTFTANTAIPNVRVSNSAAQGFSSGILSYQGLSWDTETYDANGMHSTAANSSRLVCAQSSGTYHIGGFANFPTNAGSQGQMILRLMVNDATVIAEQASYWPSGGGGAVQVCIGTDYRATSTADYFTMLATVSGNSTWSVSSNACFFAHYVSNV